MADCLAHVLNWVFKLAAQPHFCSERPEIVEGDSRRAATMSDNVL